MEMISIKYRDDDRRHNAEIVFRGHTVGLLWTAPANARTNRNAREAGRDIEGIVSSRAELAREVENEKRLHADTRKRLDDMVAAQNDMDDEAEQMAREVERLTSEKAATACVAEQVAAENAALRALLRDQGNVVANHVPDGVTCPECKNIVELGEWKVRVTRDLRELKDAALGAGKETKP